MGLIAMLPNYNPACRKSFTIVETVKEATAVCRSFLDGVVIFTLKMTKSVSGSKEFPQSLGSRLR